MQSPAVRQMSSGAKPFRVLGIQQIAIGGLDKSVLTKFWVNTLGIEKVGEYKAEVRRKEFLAMALLTAHLQKENVDEDILTLGSGAHKVEIDLMQPLDPNKSPKVHIPALNHVGLWVDNLENAVENLTAQGINFTPGGIRKGACKCIFNLLLLTFTFSTILLFAPYSWVQCCFCPPKIGNWSSFGARSSP